MRLNKQKILITGSEGFFGRNLLPEIKKRYDNIFCPKQIECDLRVMDEVKVLFNDIKPDIVIHLAADVGGKFYLKKNQASNYFNNIMINTNVVEESVRHNVERLIAISSSTLYPQNIKSPLSEDQIWDGFPEKDVSSYALSKRMMIYHLELCYHQYKFNSLNLIFDNCYGPFDNFNLNNARVVPSLIMRVYNAKINNVQAIKMLGSGSPKRGFIFIEDAIKIIIDSIAKFDITGVLNVGSKSIYTIAELASEIARYYSYSGIFNWNEDNKIMSRYLDISQFNYYFPKIIFTDIEYGLRRTIKWFEDNINI